MNTAVDKAFPITLDAEGIQAVLPHRGDILFVRKVVALTKAHFVGEAFWSSGLQILQGHFPGLPMVPGVFVIEAVAQVAGAGMLVSDDHAASTAADHVGVLAGVRKCSFKRAIPVDRPITIDVKTRHMSPLAASVSGLVSDAGGEFASIDILILKTPREQLAVDVETSQARPQLDRR